jgi:hypothetical protein
MATMADLEEVALSLPQTTKQLTNDGRPEYYVHGKLFCCHRGRRKDALDAESGLFFTTAHFDGYAGVLLRIPQLERLGRDELEDLVAEAWLTRAQKRVAKAWLAEQG